MKNYRHGDLMLREIEKLPEGLEKSDKKVLMIGRNGNDHVFDNGDFYPKRINNFVFGFFVSKKTTLKHSDHGKIIKGMITREAKLEDGIYELRNQVEHTHSGMVQVAD